MCLQKDPANRPTAKELLRHPFITRKSKRTTYLVEPIERYREWKAKGGSGQPTDSESSSDDDDNNDSNDQDGWVETIRDKSKKPNVVEATKTEMNVPMASNAPLATANMNNNQKNNLMNNIKSNTVSSSSGLAANMNNSKKNFDWDEELTSFNSNSNNSNNKANAVNTASNNSSNSNNVVNNNINHNTGNAMEAALLNRNQTQNVSTFFSKNNK